MLALPASVQSILPPAPILEFKGSRLGMSLEEWRAAPFPGATTIAVRPVCSDQAKDAARLGLQTQALKPGSQTLVCTYAFAGPAGPRDPVPISDNLYARRTRYVFKSGRLAEISFMTSPNAFDAMVARIDAQMGSTRETSRSTAHIDDLSLPQVRLRWSGAAGIVTLVDPDTASGLIEVNYVALGQPGLGAEELRGSAPPFSKSQPSG